MFEHIISLTTDWNEVEIRDLMRALNLRRDMVTRLWDYIYGKQNITFYERDRTTSWIAEFGYELVKQGFAASKDSGIPEKQCMRYIDKVIRNLAQEQAILKEKEFAKEKQKEVSLITGDKIRPKTDLEPKKWEGFAKKALDK